jgi:hypothetical protein
MVIQMGGYLTLKNYGMRMRTIHLAQDRDQWWGLLNAETKLLVP